MGMSPFQVMQNLNVIHGRPSWSSQFIIGLIQGCGRFEGFTYDETADSCQCVRCLKTSGEQVSGPKITLDMAKREGWTKNTKWSTMPQTMLRYRAASAFGRFHIPDLILGIQSVEENEVIEAEIEVVQETTESKLDQVNNLLAPVTDTPQEQGKTDPPPEPSQPLHQMSQTIFLTDVQLSERWHINRQTLSVALATGFGPKFVKINGSIRYKLSDVEAFEEHNTITPE